MNELNIYCNSLLREILLSKNKRLGLLFKKKNATTRSHYSYVMGAVFASSILNFGFNIHIPIDKIMCALLKDLQKNTKTQLFHHSAYSLPDVVMPIFCFSSHSPDTCSHPVLHILLPRNHWTSSVSSTFPSNIKLSSAIGVCYVSEIRRSNNRALDFELILRKDGPILLYNYR